MMVVIFLCIALCIQCTSSDGHLDPTLTLTNAAWEEPQRKSSELYEQAVEIYMSNEDVSSERVVQVLRQSLSYDSNNYLSNQLIGAILLYQNHNLEAIHHLELALHLGSQQAAADVSNLLEAYRRVKQFDKGRHIGANAYTYLFNSTEYLKNYGLLLQDSRSYEDAVVVYRRLVELDSNDKLAWEILIRLYADHVNIQEAEWLSQQAVAQFPDDYRILFQYGAVQHLQQRVDIALQVYQQVYQQNPEFIPALSNLGAIFQSLGRTDEALHWYLKAYELQPNDPGILNNLGSLHGIMGMKEKELEFLLASISLDPVLEPVLVNLAGHYQDDGLNDQAREYLYRAFKQAPSAAAQAQFAFRLGTMLSPIAMSWKQMIYERLEVERNLLYLIHYQPSLSAETAERLKVSLESASDRIHFYLVYHGYNDRYMQELFAKAYHVLIRDIDVILPALLQPPSRKIESNDQSHPKIRVAFISKFFGVFEPHGQLLDGIMKYLPRDIFTVICFPIVRTDGKPLGANIIEAVDEIYEIPLLQRQAIEFIGNLKIDILIFADVLSEPINHYLAFTRLAKVQIAFWGNPVTSASKHMDYFISGYHLEHPYRTHMTVEDEPYTEQVVLLSGQGIWYNHPQSPETDIVRANLSLANRKLNASREEFGFERDWFIFLCPQSTFKIHPLFDQVHALTS
jgi:protein O-GlcNAc transferase